MRDIYNDKTYLNNNPDWHEHDAPFKAGKIIKLLDRNLIPLKTICEVGCGSGEILIQLSSKLPGVSEFLGIDISRDAMEIAKKKEKSNIKFELKDIQEESGFFDLVLVIDVIEHLENYFSFLNDILSKGRYTIFHIPLDMCVWSLFREDMLIESKNRVGHIHNFTEKFIEHILQDSGFTIIDRLYTEPTYAVTSFKQIMVSYLRKLIFKINKRFCTKTIGGYSILLLTKNNYKKSLSPD